jgi:hypothetical protein
MLQTGAVSMVATTCAFLAAATPSPTAPPAERTPGSGATPVWLSILLAVLTLGGVLLSAWLLRRTGREARVSAQELDRRDKREETMRTLRWAAELAVSADMSSADMRKGRLGVAALDALGGSAWLEAEDQVLIDAIIETVMKPAADAYHERGAPSVYEALFDDEAGSGSAPQHTQGAEGVTG